MLRKMLAAVAVALVLPSLASAQSLVYKSRAPNGFYTAINTANQNITFGDSGWLTNSGNPPVQIGQVILGLAVWSPTGAAIPAGTTDIQFTFNDGEPTGTLFGSGAVLYSTTISNVTLPAITGGVDDYTYFDLTVDLPAGIFTAGNFNNVGWSFKASSFSYGANLGFQNSGTGNLVGSFTDNYVQKTGAGPWQFFNFGGAPSGYGNMSATIYTYAVPEPTSILSVVGMSMLALRRRARA